jgi:hypothetical protein
VEYSCLESGVTIGDGSIVSNMMVPAGVTIPPGCFLHTVCVMVDQQDGLFVTVVFSIRDNVKKVVSRDTMNALKFCGQPMEVALKNLAINQEVNLVILYISTLRESNELFVILIHSPLHCTAFSGNGRRVIDRDIDYM